MEVIKAVVIAVMIIKAKKSWDGHLSPNHNSTIWPTCSVPRLGLRYRASMQLFVPKNLPPRKKTNEILQSESKVKSKFYKFPLIRNPPRTTSSDVYLWFLLSIFWFTEFLYRTFIFVLHLRHLYLWFEFIWFKCNWGNFCIKKKIFNFWNDIAKI